MGTSFETGRLAVGYNRRILVRDISIRLEPGKILTLVGPNGAGKSTILKTISRQLPLISGNILIGSKELEYYSGNELAKKMAVVLTERIDPELMTCAEVAAMGRYPYTDMFGKLTRRDNAAVTEALELVHALPLADHLFATLSDGQKQRIMLARAICQEPDIILLDEPTAYLDIRYKIDILEILRNMARTKGTIVIMSLHEIDLAMKISDELLFLRGDTIAAYGPPEKILADCSIEELFDLQDGSYDPLFGSVELPAPIGFPKIFVIAGNGKGTPCFRELQKRGIPFAAGILFENDVDCLTARALSRNVFTVPAFEPIPDDVFCKAKDLLLRCAYVLDVGTQLGTFNRQNADLLRIADDNGIPVCHDPEEIGEL